MNLLYYNSGDGFIQVIPPDTPIRYYYPNHTLINPYRHPSLPFPATCLVPTKEKKDVLFIRLYLKSYHVGICDVFQYNENIFINQDYLVVVLHKTFFITLELISSITGETQYTTLFYHADNSEGILSINYPFSKFRKKGIEIFTDSIQALFKPSEKPHGKIFITTYGRYLSMDQDFTYKDAL